MVSTSPKAARRCHHLPLKLVSHCTLLVWDICHFPCACCCSKGLHLQEWLGTSLVATPTARPQRVIQVVIVIPASDNLSCWGGIRASYLSCTWCQPITPQKLLWRRILVCFQVAVYIRTHTMECEVHTSSSMGHLARKHETQAHNQWFILFLVWAHVQLNTSVLSCGNHFLKISWSHDSSSSDACVARYLALPMIVFSCFQVSVVSASSSIGFRQVLQHQTGSGCVLHPTDKCDLLPLNKRAITVAGTVKHSKFAWGTYVCTFGRMYASHPETVRGCWPLVLSYSHTSQTSIDLAWKERILTARNIDKPSARSSEM